MTEHGEISGTQLSWAVLTDVGRVRSLNEDAAIAAPPVFAVADGMGGHEAGEVASALTASRLSELAEQASGNPVSMDDVADELRNVNELLVSGRPPGDEHTMGTTAVGLAMIDYGGSVAWLVFNIGDSRLYSWFDGDLVQVTRDHSYVQELVDAGRLRADEAQQHSQRNIITKALGADRDAHPDYWLRPVRAGERFLICSDGLTSDIGDDVLAAELGHRLEADSTAERLVELALDAGGRDNVTVVVVDVVGVDATVETTTQTNRLLAAQIDEGTIRRRDMPSLPHVEVTGDGWVDSFEAPNSLAEAMPPIPDHPGDGLIDDVPPIASSTPSEPESSMADLIDLPPPELRPDVAPTEESAEVDPVALIEAMPSELADDGDGSED